MATTPTSAPGSRVTRGRAGRPAAPRLRAQHGFTLIELLIVVAIIAIASAVATLALRDPAATQLDREGARLAALLESARAEARALGVPVRWVPTEDGFRFVGLPEALTPRGSWLGEGVSAEVQGPRRPLPGVVLGPEPIIGAQRIVLRAEHQQLTLVTDGIGPFVVADDTAP